MLTVEDWIFLPACKSVSSVNSAWFERTYCMATSSITNTILIRFSIGMGGGGHLPQRQALASDIKRLRGAECIKFWYPLALWPTDRFQRKKSLDSIIEKILNMHTEVNNNCIYLTYLKGVVKNIRKFFLTKRKRLCKKLLSVWHGKGKEVFTLTIHIFIFFDNFFFSNYVPLQYLNSSTPLILC